MFGSEVLSDSFPLGIFLVVWLEIDSNILIINNLITCFLLFEIRFKKNVILNVDDHSSGFRNDVDIPERTNYNLSRY